MKKFSKRLSTALLAAGLISAQADPLPQPVLDRYEQMLLKTPEAGTAFDKIYQHYLESEGLDSLAKRWSEAATKDEKARGDFLLLLGLLEERRGRSDQALAKLQEATQVAPSWRTFSALAASQAPAGKLKEAVESYKSAIAAAPPADALQKLYRGLALCQQRLMDMQGASETWLAYAKSSGGDPFVIEEAGTALIEAERYDDARTLFEQIRKMPDADPARKLSATLKLADLEQLQNHKDAALKIYAEALTESGNAGWLQRDIRQRVEQLFRADDDLPGLAKYYDERLNADPGDLESALRLADVLGELNRNEEALKVLQAASEKATQNREIPLKLAEALFAANRSEQAATTLSALLKTFPSDPVIIEKLGDAQWRSFKAGKGKRETAIATWRTLPSDANSIQNLAEIFRAHELSDEALVEYRRALALDPTANDRRERLAEYLVQLDRKDKAIKELDAMVAGDLASGETYLRLAKILRRFGDDKLAREALVRAKTFTDRTFDRLYLEWQIDADEKSWEPAETVARAMRDAAQSDPEIERADESLAQSLAEQKKADTEIAELIGRRKTEEFSERDYRLLFILAQTAEDKGSSEWALTEGLKKFPNSVMLARLEAAYARRNDDAPRRIASLERLQQIDPQRAGEWMAERVRAYRDAERWDDAIRLAQEGVQAAPAKAEAHLLLADTYVAAKKPDEAIASLKAAVKLSDSPNQIRLRLAEMQIDQQRTAEAREVLDEAFEAEETPAGKLQLTGRLANAYMQDGKVEELISKFRDRQKAEQGWRYALYLAEVYLTLQDSVNAMQELDKALAGKPDDPLLLKKLLGLADTSGDIESSVRYARKLAQVEPSKANRAQLGEALAAARQLDEVLALIRENPTEFLEDPNAWQDSIRALQVDDRAGDLATMLEARLKVDSNDWKSLLALGQILMSSGQSDQATAALWKIFDCKEETQPQQPAPTPPPSPTTARRMMYSGGMFIPGGANFGSRQARWGANYASAVALLSQNPQAMGLGRRYGGAQSPATLQEAKDAALTYLAVIATREQKDKEFLTRLKEVLKDQPPSEKLSIFSMLQAPQETIQVIRDSVDTMDDNDLAISEQMLRSILVARDNPNFATIDTTREELLELQEKVSKRIDASGVPKNPMQRYMTLAAMGKQEEAAKLVDQIIAEADPNDIAQLTTAMNLAIGRDKLDAALQLREKLRALRKQSATVQQDLNYALVFKLFTSKDHRAKATEVLSESFEKPSSFTPGGYGAARQQFSWPQLRNALTNVIPYPTKELSMQQVNILRNLSQQSPQLKESQAAIVAQFTKLAKERSSSSLAQAAIWLQWFSGSQKEATKAMETVIAQSPSDAAILNYSMMLAEQSKLDAALKALDKLQTKQGDVFETAQRLRFALALQTDDKDAQKAAALKLAQIKLYDFEQANLIPEMKRLGMNYDAEKLAQRAALQRPNVRQTRQTLDTMRRQSEAGKAEEATALALAILSKDPLARSASNDRYQQDEALRTLKKFDQLQAYIDKLKVQLEADPDSPKLNAQIAQALRMTTPELAEPYFRKLSELRPKDMTWLSQLGDLLTSANENEEAMAAYEKVLSQDPAVLFQQGSNFVEPYRETQSWQRLSNAIVNAPLPKTDRLMPGGRDFSYIFRDIGTQLQRARPAIDPSDFWLKSLEWGGSDQQVRPALVQSLMKHGRKDEARKVLEEGFFPAEEKSTGELFVFNQQRGGNSIWNNTMMYGSGRVENPAIQLLGIARNYGFLDAMLPRFEGLNERVAFKPITMARIVARDPGILPELKKNIAANVDNISTIRANAPLTRAVADDLADWPEGRDISYTIFQALAKPAPQGYSDPYGQMGSLLQIATMAKDDGKKETLQKALKDWAAAYSAWQQRGSAINIEQGVKVIRLMMDAGMQKDALSLMEMMRTSPSLAGNSYYKNLFKEVENEIGISKGQSGELNPVLVWAQGKDEGRLIWQFRISGNPQEDVQTTWVNDRAPAKAAGDYDLDILFGESRGAMKKLVSKPGAEPRGTWTGNLPKPQGFLQAVLRKGVTSKPGPLIPVMMGNQLIPKERLTDLAKYNDLDLKGWSSVPVMRAVLAKGGPLGGEYVRLESSTNGNTADLTTERVAVDPKKNYLASCWYRFPQNEGHTQIMWRLTDADGKDLGNYGGTGNFRGDRWNYTWRLFGAGSESIPMPSNAAWLEATISFNGSCELQGLSLVEIAPPPKAQH